MLGLGVRTFGQEDIEAAHQYAEQSLRIYREIGSLRGIARSLLNLGLLECILAHYELGRDYCTESLQHYRQIGNRLGVAHCSTFLGYAYLGLQDVPKTSQTLLEALEMTIKLQAAWLIPMILGGVSYFYVLKGEVEYAATLYGLAEVCPSIRADLKDYGLPVLLNNQLKRLLDPVTLAAARERGSQLNLENTLLDIIRDLQEFNVSHKL